MKIKKEISLSVYIIYIYIVCIYMCVYIYIYIYIYMKWVFLTCKEQCHSPFSYHTHKVIGLIVWNGSTRLIGSKERKYPCKNAQELLTWKQSFFQAVPCEVKMKEDEKRRIQDESNPRAEATETKWSLLKGHLFL